LRNRAGAETDDEIAGTRIVAHDAGKLFRPVERDHLAMAACAQTRDESVAVDAGDRRLAGRINGGNNDGIGIVETGAEIDKQVSR